MKLIAARAEAGLLQREVIAELKKRGCHISKNTLISYEKGRTKPDIATAKMLADLYGQPIDNIDFF